MKHRFSDLSVEFFDQRIIVPNIAEKDMGWNDRDVNDCSHIYSDGRGVPVLFETDKDKIEGLNLMAITALETGVVILMAVAMTTHVHSITAGLDYNRWRYKVALERKLDIRRSKLGLKCKIRVSKDDIRTENELKDKVIYDYRNPIAAGFAGMPWHYPGGVGDIFFSDHKARIESGRLISDLSVTDRRNLFHTRIELPSDWTYWPDGRIVPDCYIDYKRLERLFMSPKGALAFMYQSKEKEAAEDALCARELIKDMSEKNLRHIAKRHGKSIFGQDYLTRLSEKEKFFIAQKMWADRDTYSISALGRATHLDKTLLETILLPPK